jgi:hypothetical protein
MDGSWQAAAGLVAQREIADLLGQRHRIIANDMQAASMSSLAGRLLARAADLVESLDLTPGALRADLADDRRAADVVLAATELIDHASDVLSESASLTHDNEPRWRAFRSRVVELLDDEGDPNAAG